MLNIKTNSLLLLGFFCCFFLNAQTFKNKATIEPVAQTGFYAISITPELSSYVKTDFRDLRIVDDKGNAVPYIIKKIIPHIQPAEFEALNIVSNEIADSGRNSIIIESNVHEKISDLFIKIKNTSTSRMIDLSGSDDKQHWFSVSENIMLERRFVTDDDNYIEKIAFPLSSYQYYKITIYNGKNDPLNVLQVGNYIGKKNTDAVSLVENPPLTFEQKDSSDHFSYIKIKNPERFHVGHITVHLKSPKYFKRDIDIISAENGIGSFTISSDSVFQFYLPAINDSVFKIRINNGDNPPLAVTAIATAQDSNKAIAYLQANTHYTLELNNDSVSAPHYDLQNFKDSISFDAPELKLSAIQQTEMQTQKIATNPFQQWWMWPVIILVLLTLVMFTVRLLKDVEKKN
jgi:hypothetical protein